LREADLPRSLIFFQGVNQALHCVPAFIKTLEGAAADYVNCQEPIPLGGRYRR
jgi:hypothetical protein